MTETVHVPNIQKYSQEIIDGELILKLRIPNIQKYTQEIVNGELILTQNKYITEEELINLSSSYSINNCVIKKGEQIISTKGNQIYYSVLDYYRSVLVDILKFMPTQRILQTTKFNFKLTNENNEKGYKWCSDINMSFQYQNTKETLKELINMVKVNKLSINLSIKLKTGQIIFFNPWPHLEKD